jgi:hypothetical protein
MSAAMLSGRDSSAMDLGSQTARTNRALYYLLLLLALGRSLVGVLVGGLRVLLGSISMLFAFGVIALAMMPPRNGAPELHSHGAQRLCYVRLSQLLASLVILLPAGTKSVSCL